MNDIKVHNSISVFKLMIQSENRISFLILMFLVEKNIIHKFLYLENISFIHLKILNKSYFSLSNVKNDTK
jgi:hypothetical protein